MNEHLNDEQLSAALLAEADASVAAHLSICNACRHELESIRTALTAVRAESLALGERPVSFWREQRRAIAARLTAGNELETRPLAWAASLSAVALVAAFLVQGVPPIQLQVGPTAASTGVSVAVDSDHELLVDVARFTRRDVPRALEPATLIAQELHRAAGRKSDR
jgi:predicted anti-sigma-YlaC factor YlaD